MINKELINPNSIVVVGGSNDVRKPGGKIVKNILDGRFQGELYVVNPKETKVQGVDSYSSVEELPQVELAIIVIPAAYCLLVTEKLVKEKGTKAFIFLSAGFGEADDAGKELESKLVDVVNSVNGCLIGPNCIGVLNTNYNGVFTTPIPPLHKHGCDLVSGSGATAVFIMEAGIPLGLKFNNVFSVGNGAQTGVEEVLEYMDINYNPDKDSDIKLLYLETIKNPQKLLKHASSLIRKGVKIAAIKAGSTDAGSRAAASHTGAIANPDMVVRALFRKSGIVYCSSREELLSAASIFNYKELKGKNIAIITHAGGSAVMLADALSSGGLQVPTIEGENADKLLSYLHPGSSVSNPIDFLATGTAEQLGIIIDYCEHKFDNVDAMAVVFGSPGLFDVENVYNVLSVKLDVCSKPIYPVLPSVINAQKEIQGFLAKENVNFPDEVVLGRALSHVYYTQPPSKENIELPEIDKKKIRQIIDNVSDGFIDSEAVCGILDAAGIPRVHEYVSTEKKSLETVLKSVDFPIVMKVVGPVHKSDVGGVVLDVKSEEEAFLMFDKLMEIEDSTGVLVQPMITGIELFAGVNKEIGFGHAVLCGLGGIFIEVLNDVSAGLSPISKNEATRMIKNLKAYKLIEGVRGKEGVNEEMFINIVQRLSALTEIAPEIKEMDMNPLLGNSKGITAVDTRILIEK